MKVVIVGPFRNYEEMKKLAQEMEKEGIETVLPRHFRNYQNSAKIEKLKKEILSGKVSLNKAELQRLGEIEAWFFEQIKESDVVVVYNKKEKEGEIGINTAMDVAVAMNLGKLIIFLYPPTDIGIQGLMEVIENMRVINRSKVVSFLKEYL